MTTSSVLEMSETADPATCASRLKVVLLKDKYQSTFMSPRVSRHEIQRSVFAPFNKVKRSWDGFTLLPPFQGEQLVHAHNRIPIGAKRYICSFESILPRIFGVPDNSLVHGMMMQAIESNKCRRIVAMSHAGKVHFLNQHKGSPQFERLKGKLMVRHPNVHLGAADDELQGDNAERLVVTFVGGHFGRKGGPACLRAAELALERKLPITFNIISSLQVGASNWIDPTLPGFFEPDFEKLKLPNVRHFPGIGNAEVRALLRQSHFSALPTIADSFGYSMIESMAEHTPVIASRLTAVPEVVAPGYNGFMLDLPTDAAGDWISPGYSERGTEAYAVHFREAMDNLALQMVNLLESMVGQRETLLRLRKNAYTTAKYMYSAKSQGALWDKLYERVAAEDPRSEPVLDPALDISSPETPMAFLGDRFV